MALAKDLQIYKDTFELVDKAHRNEGWVSENVSLRFRRENDKRCS